MNEKKHDSNIWNIGINQRIKNILDDITFLYKIPASEIRQEESAIAVYLDHLRYGYAALRVSVPVTFYALLKNKKLFNKHSYNIQVKPLLYALLVDFNSAVKRIRLLNSIRRSPHRFPKTVVGVLLNLGALQTYTTIKEINMDHDDKEVNFLAVLNDGLLIKHIKNPSVEICLAAVKQNGLAIQYIENPSVYMQVTALLQDPSSYRFIKHLKTKEWNLVRFVAMVLGQEIDIEYNNSTNHLVETECELMHAMEKDINAFPKDVEVTPLLQIYAVMKGIAIDDIVNPNTITVLIANHLNNTQKQEDNVLTLEQRMADITKELDTLYTKINENNDDEESINLYQTLREEFKELKKAHKEKQQLQLH